uniref:Secreted protein n=1 Tax=Macrostomum lignano TaxID=282301 RepID=A0A1I8F996_9PLAT
MAALKFFDFAFVAMVTGMLIIVSDLFRLLRRRRHHRHDDEDDLDEHLHLRRLRRLRRRRLRRLDDAGHRSAQRPENFVIAIRTRRFLRHTAVTGRSCRADACRKYRFTGRKLVCVSYFKQLTQLSLVQLNFY